MKSEAVWFGLFCLFTCLDFHHLGITTVCSPSLGVYSSNHCSLPSRGYRHAFVQCRVSSRTWQRLRKWRQRWVLSQWWEPTIQTFGDSKNFKAILCERLQQKIYEFDMIYLWGLTLWFERPPVARGLRSCGEGAPQSPQLRPGSRTSPFQPESPLHIHSESG